MKKPVSFHCYCFLLGDCRELVQCFPSRQERAQSPSLRIRVGITNKVSCLFMGVRWRIRKFNQSTKLFLWGKLRGLWSKMKIRSLFEKERETETHTPHTERCCTFANICVFLQCSSESLPGQSTGNAGIRYILIRAHKTLSRMLCCPGECTEQGTFTNSRSVSPLHHCEKNKFMRLNYMDVIYWNC